MLLISAQAAREYNGPDQSPRGKRLTCRHPVRLAPSTSCGCCVACLLSLGCLGYKPPQCRPEHRGRKPACGITSSRMCSSFFVGRFRSFASSSNAESRLQSHNAGDSCTFDDKSSLSLLQLSCLMHTLWWFKFPLERLLVLA